MKNKIKAGFTIIELLVVIAIIAILTGIVVTNLTSSRSKARDAQRISDLSHIQLAIDLYYDRCKQYPAQIADTSAANGCGTSGINLGSYISKIPTEPTGDTYDYFTAGAPPTDYVLHVRLENSNDVQRDSLPPNALTSECFDAMHPLDFCLGPK